MIHSTQITNQPAHKGLLVSICISHNGAWLRDFCPIGAKQTDLFAQCRGNMPGQDLTTTKTEQGKTKTSDTLKDYRSQTSNNQFTLWASINSEQIIIELARTKMWVKSNSKNRYCYQYILIFGNIFHSLFTKDWTGNCCFLPGWRQPQTGLKIVIYSKKSKP